MAIAGLIVDLIFKAVGLVPTGARHATVSDAGISLNYTTVLNIIFLAFAAVLIARYLRKGGGLPMLRMMNTPITPEHEDATRPRANTGEVRAWFQPLASSGS